MLAFLAPDQAGAHRRLTKVGQRVAMIVKSLATMAKPLTVILLLSIDPRVLLLGKTIVCVCVCGPTLGGGTLRAFCLAALCVLWATPWLCVL